MGVGDPIIISDAHATVLRDVLRLERHAAEALERATLEHRILAHTARCQRAAILDQLADEYGFDSTADFIFDFGLKTITRKA